MGKGTDLVTDLLAKPLSADEIRARNEDERSRGELTATPDGQLVEEPATPREKPRVVVDAPKQTWD